MKSKSLSTDNADSLSAELSALTRKQYEALQRAPYLRMSADEAKEYDLRRVGIGEICDVLAKLR